MRFGEYPDSSGIATANAQPEAVIATPPALPPALPLKQELLQQGRDLLRMGIGKPLIARMMLMAQARGTCVEDELLASGEIDESLYFEALANMLDVPFLKQLDASRILDIAGLDTQIIRPETLRLHHPSRPPITVIVPRLDRLAQTLETLQRLPALRASIVVSPASEVRRAAWQAARLRRVSETVGGLFETAPLHSARITFWGRQGFYTGILLCGLLISAVTLPLISMLLVHVVLSLFYLANLMVRFYALFCAFRQERRHRDEPVSGPAEITGDPLPVYSVLVALYKEKAMAAQLVQALDRLDWPRSRLDIKLVCEEDDAKTIAVLETMRLAPEYEIVRVPVRLPRTKPKALTYALPGCRGSLLVVYDAEDRPDPGQLREAYSAFAKAPPHIICLQAPLIITNSRQSWLSALFALEYAGLFRGLLPMLSVLDLPLPLGGTSNHFRTATLKAIGGWDPYNMTEDADLGMRLHRLGYRARVISKPTFEDAPVTLGVWLGQRTRWFKGWLQTWLVLMREPGKLAREMGFAGFIVFQILIAGLLLSSLGHPIIIAFLVYLTWTLLQQTAHAADSLTLSLFVIDTVNIFGSYAVFIALGRNRMTRRERRAVGWQWIFVPVYWLVMSAAAWKAVFELRSKPFVWNKTPHVPVFKTDN
jgi:cellulose synthase/poly-beta-1,6-N-acetylglucosamine synthase-like glycosyltransferase